MTLLKAQEQVSFPEDEKGEECPHCSGAVELVAGILLCSQFPSKPPQNALSRQHEQQRCYVTGKRQMLHLTGVCYV